CRLLNRKKDGDETLTKRQIARMLGIAPVTLYRIEKYQAEDLANVPRSER
ncbi:recombinase family protein, partial [Lactobacillus paracasei]|nr:recombinase family protein [Lacticaseibacillus paracasei]